jgi:hypothetical protein
MVGPQVLRDLQFGTEERRSNLRDQLLCGIVIVAEAIPILRSRRCFAPVQCTSS